MLHDAHMEDHEWPRNRALEGVFSDSPDAIIFIDKDGIILDLNPATTHLFGYGVEELRGKNVSTLMPSPHREQHDSYLERHLRTGYTRIIGIGREVEGRRKDGSLIPVDLSVTRVELEGEEVVFAGILRDVSDRRAMLLSLEDRESELRAIINTAADAIIVIDRHALIRLYNPAAESIFGYSVHDVLGKNVKMLMPSPFRENHDHYVQNFLRSGIPRIIGMGRTVSGLHKSGRSFPMQLSVSEVRRGNTVQFVGIVHDLSEERNMQQALASRQEEERKRIGQDLHDVLAQQLAGLTMMGRTLSTKLKAHEDVPDEFVEETEALVELARAALDESRRLAGGLFPVALERDGLVSALRDWTISQQTLHPEFTVEIECESERLHLEQEVKLQLYRIAQEAVTNAFRHSGGDRVSIQFIRDPDFLEMRIIDNGNGFEPEQASEGMGTSSMQHRAGLLGANYQLISYSEGTEVICRLFQQNKNEP